jgi:hypothetical protein
MLTPMIPMPGKVWQYESARGRLDACRPSNYQITYLPGTLTITPAVMSSHLNPAIQAVAGQLQTYPELTKVDNVDPAGTADSYTATIGRRRWTCWPPRRLRRGFYDECMKGSGVQFSLGFMKSSPGFEAASSHGEA